MEPRYRIGKHQTDTYKTTPGPLSRDAQIGVIPTCFSDPNYSLERTSESANKKRKASQLIESDLVVRSRQDSIRSFNTLVYCPHGVKVQLRTCENFCTGLNIDQVLTAREALVVDQVLQEVVEITRVARDRTRCYETVDREGSIGTNPQIPANAINCDCGDWRATGSQGSSSSNGRKPDHDLVVGRLIAIF